MTVTRAKRRQAAGCMTVDNFPSEAHRVGRMRRQHAHNGGAVAEGSGGAATAGHEADVAPRAVTRGESSRSTQAAKVDWLNATFPEPGLSPEGFVGQLARLLGRPLSPLQGRGMLGFKHTLELWAHVGSRRERFGTLAHGGSAQAGRWMLQIPGGGCSFVRDWACMASFLQELDAKITRLDLAVDFLDGEHSVDDARGMYEAGSFQMAGHPPTAKFIDDMGSREGRTLYVGKAANGKSLRVYEKGRQLGDPESDWCRFEVQFGNRDRVIPFEALTERDAFFAGAYPALADLLDEAGTQIDTMRAAGMVTLAHQWHHMRRSYGKLLDTVAELGIDSTELVEEARVFGVPRRLHLPSVAGLDRAEVLALLKAST